MGRLNNKVAIITGSGRGLGRAYALGMAEEGALLVVNDISEVADGVVKEIQDAGGRAASCIAAVGTRETAEKLVETAENNFGKLDILVNNAGQTEGVLPMVDLDEEWWDETLQIHLKAAFLNSQAVAKYMIERGIKGKIINTASEAGLYGAPGRSAYSSAKAGIIGFTYAVSRELAHNGITVNAVIPRARTRRIEDLDQGIKDYIIPKYDSESSIGRLGWPEDVAPLVVFLASDEASYISGQVITAAGCIGVL